MFWRELPNDDVTLTHHLDGPAPACAHDFSIGIDRAYRPLILNGRSGRCGRPRRLIGSRDGLCPNSQAALLLANGVEVPQSFWAPIEDIQDGGKNALVIILVPADGKPPFVKRRGRTLLDVDWQGIDGPWQHGPQIVNKTQWVHEIFP